MRPPARPARPRSTSGHGLAEAAALLAGFYIAGKAAYLGPPDPPIADHLRDYILSLAAISYRDVLLAAVVGIAGAVIRPAGLTFGSAQARVFIALAGVSCVYHGACLAVFPVLGGFATYPLLLTVIRIPMLRHAAAARLAPGTIVEIVAGALAYIGLAAALVARAEAGDGRALRRPLLALAVLCAAWTAYGHYGFVTRWGSRQGWRVAENPEWVLVSSWWTKAAGERTVLLPDRFSETDLEDFQPPVTRGSPGPPASSGRFNVIVLVLESVAARWTSLDRTPYETTPTLKSEASHAIVFDHAYAHVGRSSNALVAMLLSAYPKLDFRDVTAEYPGMSGTSLAALLQDAGYRTAFITSSDMRWAGMDRFVREHGFAELRDSRNLPCTPPLSEWGIEDRCMVDAAEQFVHENADRRFFLMAWTTETHYPYEPPPNVPLLDLVREPGPDPWDLGRYLNVLHETDRQLSRLFAALRQEHLDRNTLVVVVGDHGQAFGYPHGSYGQGRTAYEEDVRVPLMLWRPGQDAEARSSTVGGQVDLAPTIAGLIGVAAAPDWQGRSLFDSRRTGRVYFYVAEERFSLGLREDDWKYLLDLRAGLDELYDLNRDRDEQHNLALAESARAARMRERLAAWLEANRRQYP
jgi:arylsulfatase A-like enzyme